MPDNVEVLDKVQLDEEDKDLEFSRQIRKDLAKDIVKAGVPTCNRERRILLETLDGIDNSALQRKKIKADSDAANNTLVAIATIAEIFTTKNVKDMSMDELNRGIIKELDPALPDLPVIPGELEDATPISYDEFMSKMDPNYVP